MKRIIEIIKNEPVMVTNTLAIIGSWTAALGYEDFSQQEATVATLILAVVAFITRSKVTPLDKE